MVYAPAKVLDAPVSDSAPEHGPVISKQIFTPAINPALDTLEAGKRGEIQYRSPLTEEQRAMKRAFLAEPKPPTEELRAGLAVRREKGLPVNEI